jgi:hypothetical protein
VEMNMRTIRNVSLPEMKRYTLKYKEKRVQIICCNTENEDKWEKLEVIVHSEKIFFTFTWKTKPSITVVPTEIHIGYLP